MYLLKFVYSIDQFSYYGCSNRHPSSMLLLLVRIVSLFFVEMAVLVCHKLLYASTGTALGSEMDNVCLVTYC